ncbi:MAG: M1 family metallopeptidase, partial [Chloroflexota bacterium]
SESLTDIVFDVEANRFPAIFTLSSVNANLGVSSYEMTGRRLTITLDKPFAPGCILEIDLAFTLHVPEVGEGANAYGGYFGYTENQLNLGQWLPMLAIRRGGEWITHEVSAIGEQVVVDVADWNVTVSVNDATDKLMIAAPGTLVEHDAAAKRWHYTMQNAREFTISLSPLFVVQTAESERGVDVELYTYADQTSDTAKGKIDNAQQALDAATQALSMYADLFGAFPYERYIVVEGDFPDGMEFSGIVFVSDQWFRTNTGTAESYLTIITVHETSHQWWYARVGSDQALNPWMDEALAAYSEYIFFEEHYPDLKKWWWNFRVDSYVGQNYNGKRVDSSVYDFETARDYINAVYLRGAHMLDDLRGLLGTDVFFDWLRRYAQVGQNRVVTPDVFWSLLTPDQLAKTQLIRSKYLSGPQ